MARPLKTGVEGGRGGVASWLSSGEFPASLGSPGSGREFSISRMLSSSSFGVSFVMPIL